MVEEPLAGSQDRPAKEIACLQEEYRQAYAAWQQRARTAPRPLPEARVMISLGAILFLIGLACLFRPQWTFWPLSLLFFAGAIAVAAVLGRRERTHRRAYKQAGEHLLEHLHELEAKLKTVQGRDS
jgi:hypothetical protein